MQQTSFSLWSNAVKTYCFVPFVCPCMHYNCGIISGSHACRDCMWPIILGARFSTTCHWRASGSSHQVQCRKDMYLILERCINSNDVMVARFDAVRLFEFVHIPWTLQPHFTWWLSPRTFVWGSVHASATILSCVNWPWPGWTQCPSLDVLLYQVLRVSEQ